MKYIDLDYNEASQEMLRQLQVGAFLTTKKQDKINTMTIAWGGINVIWGKPVFVIYVRYSRDTYHMLVDNDEFTVSVPIHVDLRKELAFCGTKSGRDVDKFKECKLTPIKGRTMETPIIGECDQHYECKIIYRQAMEPNSIMSDVHKRYYSKYDFHMIYYGEIIDSYQTKGE